MQFGKRYAERFAVDLKGEEVLNYSRKQPAACTPVPLLSKNWLLWRNTTLPQPLRMLEQALKGALNQIEAAKE